MRAAGSLAVGDVATLLDVVHDLSDPAPLHTLRERAVARLPELIATSLASWNEIDLTTGSAVIVMDAADPEPDMLSRFRAHISSHPVIAHTGRTGDGRPYTISDFQSEDAYHSTALYREVYRYLDVEDQLSCTLPDPGVVVGIALNRTARTFTARDRTLLNLCRPYLVRARCTAIAYERSQWYLRTLERLVERRDEGLLLVDAADRVVFASPNGARLTREWFGLSARPGSAAPPRDRRVLAGEPITVRRGARMLDIDRLPGPDPTTIALLLRESGPAADDIVSLRRVGLTGRESETLLLVVDGATNAGIGERLGISTRTVEKHLQAAMHKLGVTNRVQAAGLVRDLRLPTLRALAAGDNELTAAG